MRARGCSAVAVLLRRDERRFIGSQHRDGIMRAMKNHNDKKGYRTLWISDVHLGTAACKAAHLADFLKQTECKKLYLVGDIVDGWALKSEFYWPQEHSNVVRRILTKAKRDTEV